MRPEQFLEWFFVAWFAALLTLIAYRVLIGRISLHGLLTMDGERFSPERLQLALISIGALLTYALGAFDTRSMPPVPAELTAVFAASQVLYLAGKIAGR